MDKAALARLFYQEIVKIEGNAELDRAAKIVASQRLLQALFVQATRAERLRFSTLFARIAYAGHKYRLGKRLQYHIHHFRRCAPAPEEESQALLSGYKVLCESIQALLGATPPEDFPIDIPKDWPAAHTPAEIRAFRPLARVVLLGDDPGAECFEARDEEQPHETIRVRYGLSLIHI
jgi:DNA replication ATP-dependent helicase Dna2